MALMTKVMNSQSMVGKNMTSYQFIQKKVGKTSSLEGSTTIVKNVILKETNPGGQGSSGSTFSLRGSVENSSTKTLLDLCLSQEIP